jgi:hypothetical protein
MRALGTGPTGSLATAFRPIPDIAGRVVNRSGHRESVGAAYWGLRPTPLSSM